MAEDRLKLPIPQGRVAQVQHFAHDLAWGEVEGLWLQPFQRNSREWYFDRMSGRPDGGNLHALKDKWENQNIPMPTAFTLISMGYLSERGNNQYYLEPKAMNLLTRVDGIKVFISYEYTESSAFALLVEARLILAGAVPFVDKLLRGGKSISEQIEKCISESQYFVCLIGGKETLNSTWVDREIQLAQANKNPLVWVCHNGCTVDNVRQKWPQLEDILGHEISTEGGAIKYEQAVIHILNACGLPTYSPTPIQADNNA